MSERGNWRTRREWAQVLERASRDVNVQPRVSPSNRHRVGLGFAATYIEDVKHLNVRMALGFENGLRRKSNDKTLFGLEPQLVAAKKTIRLLTKKHTDAEEKAWADRAAALLSANREGV